MLYRQSKKNQGHAREYQKIVHREPDAIGRPKESERASAQGKDTARVRQGFIHFLSPFIITFRNSLLAIVAPQANMIFIFEAGADKVDNTHRDAAKALGDRFDNRSRGRKGGELRTVTLRTTPCAAMRGVAAAVCSESVRQLPPSVGSEDTLAVRWAESSNVDVLDSRREETRDAVEVPARGWFMYTNGSTP